MSVIIKEGTEKMQQFKLICLIYELNGMVRSMSEMTNVDEQFDNPLIEPIENKMKEVISIIESTNEKTSA